MKIQEDVEATLPYRKIVPGDYVITKRDSNRTVYQVVSITNTKALGAANNYVTCRRTWDDMSVILVENNLIPLHKLHI